ncbi:zinc ribbon domain-containing protein [Achromobacter sp. GG226]|uniref:FmdB family zinc ribbon protein n=1 Tax=Verticiella alkaliphila TaxID=2779529 RepID=UPI001C0B5A2E|nr:FmdB family zinc ribbon protein [Verticiella sp. GG226]MBU4609896.1 zinc ribbon domain-containing protein [Verticiella sp. GG226]
MPIYAYKCEACGHAHDALQKMSAAPLVDCPACGKPALVKQVTAAGFQLKGSGWYVTDFRNNGNSSSGASSSGASATSGSSASSSEAAAPAATPAPAPATPTPSAT